MNGSTTASRSARNRRASIRGARLVASAMTALGTNRRGSIGRSSATGTPLRVTMILWPAWTSRRIAPESLRSSRWVITRPTYASVAPVALRSKTPPGAGVARLPAPSDPRGRSCRTTRT